MATTTITKTASANVTLTAGKWLVVSGDGTYTLGPGLYNGKIVGIVNGAKIGPFADTQTVSLCASVTDLVYYTQSAPIGTYQMSLDPASSLITDPVQRAAVAEAGRGGGSSIALRPSATSIVLDGLADYAPLTVTGATAITVTGSTRAAQASMVVIANGTNVPTVTGADEWASSFGYLNTNGVPNRLDVWYDGVAARYAWSQQMVPSVIDVSAPTLSAAAVNGSTLTLTYSETLNSTAPAASSYSVSGAGGVTQTPSSVSISGAVVTLTLGTAAVNGNTVNVSYTVPGTNPIRDTAGNAAAALTGQAVTNNTSGADTTPPAVSGAAVNGSSLAITYSESLNTNAPAASSFSVIGAGGVTQTPSAVSISGAVVTLTLTTPAVSGNTVTVSYTQPGTNNIMDAAGNAAASFSGQAVTNNTGVTIVETTLALTSLTSLTESSGTYTGAAGVSSWGAYGKPAISLAANADGWVSVGRSSGTLENFIIAFSEINTSTNATATLCSAQINRTGASPSDAIMVGGGTTAGTNTTNAGTATAGAGRRYRLGRAGSTWTVQTSSDDGATWSVVYTFAGVTSTNKVYATIFTTANNAFSAVRSYGLA